jgi:hypothetical protein
VAQLSQSFRFDLADTLAGNGEVLPDLFQCVLRSGVAETKTHLDNLLLARRERRENFVRDLTKVRESNRLSRIQYRFVLDKISEMRIFLFADRSF